MEFHFRIRWIIIDYVIRMGGGIPDGARLTEDGEPRITEDGDFRVVE